jgi:uridylate kinase
MSNTSGRKRLVISVGGSLIIPNGGINIDFLKRLNEFIREQLAKDTNRQFFLVIGGGRTAKHYIDAGQEVVGHTLTPDDLDWLGIHASRMNAHLVRTIFRDLAHPLVIKHYEIIRRVTEPIAVAAGWKPGWSTDYCAILLCQDYAATEVINLSNIDTVYDKDPNKHTDAKPIDNISWVDFRKLVGDTWTPRMNAPFDPIASKLASELGLKVAILNGNNLDNVRDYLDGKSFIGTTIK